MISTPAVYTVPEVAALLDMSESKLRGLERRGALPFRSLRHGDHIRYARADVDAYLGIGPAPAAATSADAASILLAAEIIATQTKLEYLLAQTIDQPQRREAEARRAAGATARAGETGEKGRAA